ncbi:hypothetical protein J1N35_007291 [Gossypium stocksii]|uniref:Uncharacterized protein n=1 Tax=Gossypium stocksii TaxID=47602 RepID=A0A9D3W887_9ROSI|nr:hypothetical protein J1N35_007291 [Gossypium stocksii]
MLIPRALSSNKAVYENNGRLLPSTAVLSIISNAISGISEPPTFIWMTYNEEDIAALIPSWVTKQQQLFVSNVLLIHFYMVEWHDGGRVLR